MFGPPEPIVAPMRELGARLVLVYVYWSQVEPRPGSYDWSIVDSLLSKLSGEEEVWITVCASSPWGTRTATDFLPPSPATDSDAYHCFVRELVSRCRGLVHYWQCDNEPSNVGLLWAGSAGEYATQLGLFHRAVKAADPAAAVVLGGCGYDVLSSPPDGPPRAFFDEVLARAGAWFDLFDVHLYDSPALIPAHLSTVRDMMRAHRCERAVVVGEYNGPTLFELPELDGVLHATMAAAFADTTGEAAFSTSELSATAVTETSERRALKLLYSNMDTLPPELQMFMAGCRPSLTRGVIGSTAGRSSAATCSRWPRAVRRTVCWQLAPEVGHYEDPFTMMELMHGKLPLLAYQDGRLGRRRPAADSFRRLAAHMDGAQSVIRIETGEQRGIRAFSVDRPDRGPLTVMWRDGRRLRGARCPHGDRVALALRRRRRRRRAGGAGAGVIRAWARPSGGGGHAGVPDRAGADMELIGQVRLGATGLHVSRSAPGMMSFGDEVVTGRLLRKLISREEAVLATKVFYPTTPGPNGGGLSCKHILAAIDASLTRLQVDDVDLYQIHRFRCRTPSTVAARTSMSPALRRHRRRPG